MSVEWVVVPDLQVPSHDDTYLTELTEYVRYVRPAQGLLCVGDELDSPQPSRWSKGMAEEYDTTLQADIDQCRDVMSRLRASIPKTKQFHVMRSNHGDRIEKYIARYAPALASIRALKVDVLLDYEQLGIVYHRQPFEFAPGWMLAHGDEGATSRIAGATAKNLALRWGRNVVCGHTHRLGQSAYTMGVNADLFTLWGVEVGHGMDVTKAGYLSAGWGDWQQGCALVVRNGPQVSCVPLARQAFGGVR